MTILVPPPRELVTLGLLQALRLPAVEGGMGSHRMYEPNQKELRDGSADPGQGYGIVYSIDGGGFPAQGLTETWEMAEYAYQISLFGLRRDQVEKMIGRLEGVLIGVDSETHEYATPIQSPPSCSKFRRLLNSATGVNPPDPSSTQAVHDAVVRCSLITSRI